jgi:hypothetical protein
MPPGAYARRISWGPVVLGPAPDRISFNRAEESTRSASGPAPTFPFAAPIPRAWSSPGQGRRLGSRSGRSSNCHARTDRDTRRNRPAPAAYRPAGPENDHARVTDRPKADPGRAGAALPLRRPGSSAGERSERHSGCPCRRSGPNRTTFRPLERESVPAGGEERSSRREPYVTGRTCHQVHTGTGFVGPRGPRTGRRPDLVQQG